jgi:excisionase family DNA binding protein
MIDLKPRDIPSEREIANAKELIEHLAPYKGQDLTIYINGEGEPLTLHKDFLELMNEILIQTSFGKPVTIMPINAQLTTQEAADLLGVSRPFVVGLLEQGRIPYQKVGTHRRVLLGDVLRYQQQSRVAQKEAMAELQKEAQELEMGY